MRKSILAALLILACLVSVLFGEVAYAAERGEVTLTVRQTFVDNGPSAPPSEVFTYSLIPQTAEAPMPAGSDSSGYSFTIARTRDLQIGPITFTTAGIFIYELRSVTAAQSGYTIDRRVYTVEVHVTENLEVLLVYISDGSKVTELSFAHSHQRPAPIPTPVPTSPAPNPPNPTPGAPRPIPDGPKGEDAPKTGDDSNPSLWVTLITISSVSLLFLFWLAWRSRDRRRWGA